MNNTEQFDSIIINAIENLDEKDLERRLESLGMGSKSSQIIKIMWEIHNNTAAGELVMRILGNMDAYTYVPAIPQRYGAPIPAYEKSLRSWRPGESKAEALIRWMIYHHNGSVRYDSDWDMDKICKEITEKITRQ